MKAYRVVSDAGLPDALKLEDVAEPSPKPGEVVVDIKAVSLNARDLAITKGGYPRNMTRPITPVSDGAGVVAAVGEGVTQWQVGDKVMPCFFKGFPGGPYEEAKVADALGGGVDGVLAEKIAQSADAVVRIPSGYSFEQAATLPCAGVTAWHALQAANVKAGDTVLLLGTGGVSIFGLQLAKAAGCRTIITSSSDDKLDHARRLGADVTINYQQHPKWSEQVREATGDVGVDCVIEVGGNGTLPQSLASTRVGGTVSLIGLLSGGDPPNIFGAALNGQTIKGIYVGSADHLRDLVAALEAGKIEPVIDKTFDFAEAPKAYEHLASQEHLGKIVVKVAD